MNGGADSVALRVIGTELVVEPIVARGQVQKSGWWSESIRRHGHIVCVAASWAGLTRYRGVCTQIGNGAFDPDAVRVERLLPARRQGEVDQGCRRQGQGDRGRRAGVRLDAGRGAPQISRRLCEDPVLSRRESAKRHTTLVVRYHRILALGHVLFVHEWPVKLVCDHELSRRNARSGDRIRDLQGESSVTRAKTNACELLGLSQAQFVCDGQCSFRLHEHEVVLPGGQAGAGEAPARLDLICLPCSGMAFPVSLYRTRTAVIHFHRPTLNPDS